MAQKIPSFEERTRLGNVMFANITAHAAELRELLERLNGHRGITERIYRLYHNSFKVYNAQYDTAEIVELLGKIAPEGQEFCPMFSQMLAKGTGKEFTPEANDDWLRQTAPMIEATLHAKFFLECAVACIGHEPLVDPPVGGGLEAALQYTISYTLAALLELYEIR